MNETTTTPQQRPASSWIVRVIFWVVFLPFMLFICFALLSGFGGLELAVALGAGWIAFLARTLPKITWNWDLVGMGVLCCAIVLVLSHRLLSWLTKSVAAARGAAWKWPLKWTACGLGILALLFIAGMAVGGTVHQIGWIASSPESWFERKGGIEYFEMRQLDMDFRIAVDDATNQLAEVRQQIGDLNHYGIPRSPGEPPLTEAYQVLLILDGNEKVEGWIIFPRDPRRFERYGGTYTLGETNGSLQADQLRRLIHQYQARTLSL